MAVLALGLIGAGAGAAYGAEAALIGFNSGILLGGIIFPKKIGGDKLSDLKVTTSTYGGTVQQVWGNIRVAGDIFWAAIDADGNHLVDNSTTSSQGGSGGAQITTEYATATFAVIVAHSRIIDSENNVIFRNPTIQRIWFNDKIVWDVTATTSNKLSVVFYDGTQTTADSIMDGNTYVRYSKNSPAYKNIAYCLFDTANLSDYGNRLPNVSIEIQTDVCTVGDVISDLLRQVGIKSSNIDISGVSSTYMTGFALTSSTNISDAIQAIQEMYFVDIVEYGDMIYVVQRAQDSDIVINADDLGYTDIGSGSGSDVDMFSLRRTQKNNLPTRIDLTYPCLPTSTNGYKRYLSSTQSSFEQISNIYNVQGIQTTCVLEDGVAATVANIIMELYQTELDELVIALPYNYYNIMPTTKFTLTLSNVTRKYKVVSVDINLFGQIIVTARSHNLHAYTNVADSSSSGMTYAVNDSIPAALQFVAWAGKELRDEDKRTAGFYVVAALLDYTKYWNGASIYYSTDGGTTYVFGGQIHNQGTIGAFQYIPSAFIAGTPNTYDYSSNPVIELYTLDKVLSTHTGTEVALGANTCIIGTELLSFNTATLISGTSYHITNLLRGRRQFTAPAHTATENFFMVDEQTVVRVDVPPAYIGGSVKVKVLSPGQLLSAVTAQTVTIPTPTGADIDAGTDITSGTLGTSHGGTGRSVAFTNKSVVFANSSLALDEDNSSFYYDTALHKLTVAHIAAPVDETTSLLAYLL